MVRHFDSHSLAPGGCKMTIRSSTSTHRWTNRERLDKGQDSRNNNSCRKGEQNDRFPGRILPTHYEARTRRGSKCKCCGGKKYLHGKRVGWRRGQECLRWLWGLTFWTIWFCLIRFGRIGWSNLSRRKGKASPSYAIVRDARGCWEVRRNCHERSRADRTSVDHL